MSKIADALRKKFEQHRVVFWYDTKKELRAQFESLALSDVTKVEVQGNEFEVKHRVHKQEPHTRFLLYIEGEKPANEANWLLDLELAHAVFHTDREALYLQELGLAYHLREFVAQHMAFFEDEARRQQLRALVHENDEQDALRRKMLAVVFDTDYLNLHHFIHIHSQGLLQTPNPYDERLKTCQLHDYYWERIQRAFHYDSSQPSIYDFLLQVFRHNFELEPHTALTREATLLLALWKDSRIHSQSFGEVAKQVAQDLDATSKLEAAPLEDIVEDDLFQETDYRIVSELATRIDQEQVAHDVVLKTIKARENKYWYFRFGYFYQSLKHAADLIALVRQYTPTPYSSLQEGVEHYAKSLYAIDQAYRRFVWSYRATEQNRVLLPLAQKIEKVYSNDWLLPYNNHWQTLIDGLERWATTGITSQRNFYKNHVKQHLAKKPKLVVIISDALRYECGVELSKMLQAENRYEATIEHMVSSLPSYTQLGMASLLPHQALAFKGTSDTILVDGASSVGTEARDKILKTGFGDRAVAITAEKLMAMNAGAGGDGREFLKQYDLVYVYHNHIDKVGDDKTSEDKVFEAVHDELLHLMELIKKVANMNGTNMMVTSDHGFIYQHTPLAESEFSRSGHQGEVWKENRRFVIGAGLRHDATTRAFEAQALNIASEAQVLIPRSINRLRVKGAGSRFIHGGASPQEVVVPLLKVTKKRHDTTSQVTVELIGGGKKITTGILAVSFMQTELVTDQVLARSIRAAIYASDGNILSDQFRYNFDIAEGSERQREVKHTFHLMTHLSSQYKNQTVALRLEEQIKNTDQWKEYRHYSYTLNVSSISDFDDF
ncbi:MAG TPA: BREX-1 system phosphatase PglZ type A [Microscillaceae bacterium]|nr:BREX-1 system phosphatase PglZ type A [Microscillaceae bacterium]